MPRPRQQVEILAFESHRLSELLCLVEPPFLSKGEALNQLHYIDTFVRKLGCRALLIENHYIDRHYMEDHSVFYSRNLYPYANFCRRLHFFSCEPDIVEQRLQELSRNAREFTAEDLQAQCGEFSEEAYLGFSVIKPLPGCPVGRTILRPDCGDMEKGTAVRFPNIRDYSVHVSGLTLKVRGLAFQQQDVGVSACATTAIWSSLQKLQDFEDIASATPAQITMLASQYTLPFGRAMPSEGLSLDQMCQAIRALGVAPNLFQAVDYETARGYLHSTISSELAPILIIHHPQEDLYHAIVAVGMKLSLSRKPTLIGGGFAADRAGDLIGLYVHDDRIGPYLPTLIHRQGISLALSIAGETWLLTHILIPMHPKIRLSFSGLRHVTARLVQTVQAFRETVLGHSSTKKTPIQFDHWITPAHQYLKNLLAEERDVETRRVEKLWQTVPLPRYVGVVRLQAPAMDPLHFIVDCTGTERNLHALAVLPLQARNPETAELAEFLAQRYDCWLIE